MTILKSTYTTKELLNLLVVKDASTIIRRAKREEWKNNKLNASGGGYLWSYESMPEETQTEIQASLMKELLKKLPEKGTAEKKARQVARVKGLDGFLAIPKARRTRAQARTAIVRFFEEWSQLYPKGITTARADFAFKYSSNEIQVEDWVRALVPALHFNTLANWQRVLTDKGIKALVDRRGDHLKGTGIIDSNPAMREFILGRVVGIYGDSSASIYEDLEVQFKGQEISSLRTLQEWVKNFREQKKAAIMRVQNPDGFKNKYQPAFGTCSAGIDQPNQLWELDSSPSDILLEDVTRYTLLACIDVATRRVVLHLSKTSNSAGVAALLRKAIIAFGIPQVIMTDNGADYVSRQVKSAIHALGIRQELCTPYTPEQKPHIERFFGTFNRRLAKVPGFIGHCVADRKAIEGKKSFAERNAKKKGEKASSEFKYSPAEFQEYCDRWVNIVYGEKKHSALNASPNEVAAKANSTVVYVKDIRALYVLLMPVAGDGTRVVRKTGIHVDNTSYYEPILGGYIGQEVRVYFDDNEAGQLFVYALDGDFICVAIDHDLMGVSRRELAIKAKQEVKGIRGEAHKEIRKAIRKIDKKQLVDDLLEHKEQEAEEAAKIRPIPQSVNTYSTPALEESGKAARANEVETEREFTKEQKAYAEKIKTLRENSSKAEPADSFYLYAKYIFNQELLAKGQDIGDRNRRWLKAYMTTSDFLYLEKVKVLQNGMLPMQVQRHLGEMRSAVYGVEGVKSLVFRENYTGAPKIIDEKELKPHSVYLCVDGGEDDEVAKAIFANKSAGCGYTGQDIKLEIIEPASGQKYPVVFDRPEIVAVRAQVTVKQLGTAVIDTEITVRDAILAYAKGDLYGVLASEQPESKHEVPDLEGFNVGVSVSPFELAAAVAICQPSLFVIDVKVGLLVGGTENLKSETLLLKLWQKADISSASIEVVGA